MSSVYWKGSDIYYINYAKCKYIERSYSYQLDMALRDIFCVNGKYINSVMDRKPVILDLNDPFFGCEGHPSNVHNNADVDFCYFTTENSNITQWVNRMGREIKRVDLFENDKVLDTFDRYRNGIFWNIMSKRFPKCIAWADYRLIESVEEVIEVPDCIKPDHSTRYNHHMHIHFTLDYY